MYNASQQKAAPGSAMMVLLPGGKRSSPLIFSLLNNLALGNRCFQNVEQFRYLGTAITNQNLVQEEIKRRLNSGNACYHSVQNLLSSRLLSKNIKIRIKKL
jgi:hypothetical protein